MDSIFPGKEWGRKAPEDLGLDRRGIESIGELMHRAKANGVLVRHGLIAAEWSFAGPPETTIEVQSITKNITGLLLGIALRDGLIPSLDTPVQQCWPDFDEGPYAERITFRHLVTCTSGLRAPSLFPLYIDPGYMEPGLELHYHNGHFLVLGLVLTALFGRELRVVLEEKVLRLVDAQGVPMEWGSQDVPGTVRTTDGRAVPVNNGYATSYWTAADLARIGYLYANGGRWRSRRIVAEDYVSESLTAIPYRVNEWVSEQWMKGASISEPDRSNYLAGLGYGLSWWKEPDSNLWSMGGGGGQFCTIDREHNMVMTKLNDYRNDVIIRRWSFLPLLKDCVID